MRIVVLFLALVVSTVVGIVLLLSMTGGPASPTVEQAPAGQLDETAVVSFLIHEGQSTEEIAQALQRAGLVNNTLVFRVMARLRGVDGKLQTGEYQLRRNMSVDELLVVLQHAPVKEVTITFIEGWRIEEFAAELQRRQLLDGAAFRALAQGGIAAYPWLRSRPDGASLEGYLFPSTYRLTAETTPQELLDTLLRKFGEVLTPVMREQIRSQGRTIHEVVTLASIVEREAMLAGERRRIAGVYVNRLREGIGLYADPTVQYALGYQPNAETWWKRPLLFQDLEIDSPYNTYRYAGLPPGPICNPGLASLQAAIDPEAHEFFYFVANDVAGDGSHVFARTLAEHEQNRQRYQRQS